MAAPSGAMHLDSCAAAPGGRQLTASTARSPWRCDRNPAAPASSRGDHPSCPRAWAPARQSEEQKKHHDKPDRQLASLPFLHSSSLLSPHSSFLPSSRCTCLPSSLSTRDSLPPLSTLVLAAHHRVMNTNPGAKTRVSTSSPPPPPPRFQQHSTRTLSRFQHLRQQSCMCRLDTPQAAVVDVRHPHTHTHTQSSMCGMHTYTYTDPRLPPASYEPCYAHAASHGRTCNSPATSCN